MKDRILYWALVVCFVSIAAVLAAGVSTIIALVAR